MDAPSAALREWVAPPQPKPLRPASPTPPVVPHAGYLEDAACSWLQSLLRSFSKALLLFANIF